MEIIKPLKGMLVFQTDFGYKETSVSAMYGVAKCVDRSLELIDSTHELPPFDIWSASYRLFQSIRFWPKGTIFVSVVDPGVGTARKACVAYTGDGHYVVTPDNGSLTHVARDSGIVAVREIDETVNRLHGFGTDETSVFHGRDLFGYCAAKLAAGKITFEEVGPAYDPKDVVTFDIPEASVTNGKAEGIIEIDDTNFGNLFTNIPTKQMLSHGFGYGETVHVRISHGITAFEEDIPFEKTFGDVKVGEPVLYNNELMKASLAVCRGSFVEKYHVGFGPDWRVELVGK